MNVALYIDFSGKSSVNISAPELGNPGIGGTQFNFVAMPYYINKFSPGKIRFTIYCKNPPIMPSGIIIQPVNTISEALKLAATQKQDIFLFRAIDEDLPEILDSSYLENIKLVAWAHNFCSSELLDKFALCEVIKRVVCLSQEHLDVMRYHPIFEKSTYIYYGFDPSCYTPSAEIKKNGSTVAFLGNLIPVKGFHYLAEIWPSIKKAVPSAKLKVIGTANLYDRSISLGKWGVAEESYERTFRSFLSDSNGKIDSSIEFLGLLGHEKVYILQSADVGVVNPSGASETFCMSALEFQSAGTPVVTGGNWGLLETVSNRKTGLLGKTSKDLQKNIISLLQNPERAQNYGANGIEFVKEKFSCKLISMDWIKLFEDVISDVPNKPKIISKNIFYDGKLKMEIRRLARKHTPLKPLLQRIAVR